MNRIIEDEAPKRGYGMVYAIVHEQSGRRYIGATSKKLSDRMRGHLGPLTNQKHPCPDLQAAWNQDGPEAFYVQVIERDVKDVELRDTEQKWIEHYRAEAGVYNRTRVRPAFQFGQSVFVKQPQRVDGAA